MKIILTKHAKAMLQERWKCRPEKYMKVAEKAWRSTERVYDGDIANKRYYMSEMYPDADTQYRKFMGKIFVFEQLPNCAIMITVYPSILRTKKILSKQLVYSRPFVRG